MRFSIRPAYAGKHGFTLLEILICLAIVATLAAIAVPTYTELLKGIKQDTVIEDIRQIEKAIMLFQADQGRLPKTLIEAGITLVDPWGNPYQFIPIQGQPLKGKGKVKPRKDKFLHPLNSDYDLWSMGADGKTALPLTAKASRDDIIRAGDGSYYGRGEDY
jgi:general secretion pathway protein G